MPTLLELTDDMRRLDIMLAESDGEVTPAIETALATWAADLGDRMENKVDGYAALVNEFTLRGMARELEANRLRKRATADTKAANFLRERLKLALESRGVKKIETKHYALSIVANGGVLPVEITGAVPDEYMGLPKPPDPDRKKIRQVLEAGMVLEFARLGERGTRLNIK